MSLRSRPGAAAAFIVCVVLASAGCKYASAGSRPQGSSAALAQPAAAPSDHPVFDGARAFKLLEQQCALGPRPVGSAAHLRTRDLLVSEMRKYADKTVIQDFSYKRMPLFNIIGVFNPDARRSILLCGHWDTRPTADMEIDPAKKREPIMGASDGASEIAVLLELARLFKEKKPDVGVVIVLLDGEDYGNFETDEGVFLGAKYFAKNHKGYSPEFGILLDMVGDKNLNIMREQRSQRIAPEVNDRVFSIAKSLGFGDKIIDKEGYNISDDHVSISTTGGIPTIDLIDFDYGPWHTLTDTPDKCSAESLATVGKVIAELVYREKVDVPLIKTK